MPVLRLLGVLVAVLSPALCQQMNLDRYLERLRTAPGVTVEEKVRSLSSMGVSLSPQGLRELRKAGSLPGTGGWQPSAAPAIPFPGWSAARSTPDNENNPLQSYSLRQQLSGGASLRNDWNPLDSYSIRPTPGGSYRITKDFNPMESYTARPSAGGGYRIHHDFNPMESYTARPSAGGGYRIWSDFRPMESYTARPLPGGRGVLLQSDTWPLSNYTLRER